MISNLFKFKMPTLLGLGVIVIGLGVGVYLTLQNQTLLTQATPTSTPQEINVSNISDQTITISWETAQKVSGFVKFSQGGSDEKTVLDERDNKPVARNTHFVTLLGLSPQTTYQYKIVSGNSQSKPAQFTTATSSTPNNLKPITGSVLDGEKPLAEGLIFLKLSDGTLLSATIKSLGNFIILLTILKTTDNQTGKLEVISEDGKKGSATINLLNDGPIGPLRLGQDLDLTKQITKAQTQSPYDLNGDGVVNSSDYAIVVKNFGKSAKDLQDRRIDVNSDGVVDQKDADLILAEIRKSGSK